MAGQYIAIVATFLVNSCFLDEYLELNSIEPLVELLTLALALALHNLHSVSKNCANLFLSELCQIPINFDNFLRKDGKDAKIMRDALIFHLI